MRWQVTLHTQESSESPHWRGAAPPARLPHRLPSLNRVLPQQPPPSHRLRRAGRNEAVGPDGYPLRVGRRRVGLEVTELLLLLGIKPSIDKSMCEEVRTHMKHNEQWSARPELILPLAQSTQSSLRYNEALSKDGKTANLKKCLKLKKQIKSP